MLGQKVVEQILKVRAAFFSSKKKIKYAFHVMHTFLDNLIRPFYNCGLKIVIFQQGLKH